MKKYPSLIAAAALSAFLVTQANAIPIGAPMEYTSSTIISGAVDGTGSGGGTAFFDSSGLLTIESFWDSSIPVLGATATRLDTTLLKGTVTGTTWNTLGTDSGTSIIHDCIGSAVFCTGSYPKTIIFTPGVSVLDIFTGGAWTYVNRVAGGIVTVTISDSLAPMDVPLPSTLWLFSAAALASLTGVGRRRGVT